MTVSGKIQTMKNDYYNLVNFCINSASEKIKKHFKPMTADI